MPNGTEMALFWLLVDAFQSLFPPSLSLSKHLVSHPYLLSLSFSLQRVCVCVLTDSPTPELDSQRLAPPQQKYLQNLAVGGRVAHFANSHAQFETAPQIKPRRSYT